MRRDKREVGGEEQDENAGKRRKSRNPESPLPLRDHHPHVMGLRE
jgi:hypothetical protein